MSNQDIQDTRRQSIIPFPTLPDRDNPSPVPDLNRKRSVSSTGPATTGSSRFTSSDKLAALPTTTLPAATGTGRRFTPSQYSPAHLAHLKSGWRRSWDPTISLPSISASDRAQNTRHPTGISSHTELYSNSQRRTPEAIQDGSTSRGRVSFESGRDSRAGLAPAAHSKYHSKSPPSSRQKNSAWDEKEMATPRSRTPSLSRSRATSPLRIFQQWSSDLHRSLHHHPVDELFVPVNPFQLPRSLFLMCCGKAPRNPKEDDLEMFPNGSDHDSVTTAAYDCEDLLPITSFRTFLQDLRILFFDIIPRQIYLNLSLRLPAMYFSRVAKIFEEAEVSRPDIQRMIDASCNPGLWASSHVRQQNPRQVVPGAATGIALSGQAGAVPAAAAALHYPLPYPDEWTPSVVSPALVRFKHSWEGFIESLLREWKTLNLVSALLASAILTMFQVPEAIDDPVTRTAALASLVCSLMSLSFGCVYIVRFGSMKSMYHASKWAEEARKTYTAILWNVWVMLATPAIWMAWAMLLFLTSILSFVWRTGSVLDPADRPPLHAKAALVQRIAITTILCIGLIYFLLIIRTLKTYGSHGDASARAVMRSLYSGQSPRQSVQGGRATPTTQGNRVRGDSGERVGQAAGSRRGADEIPPLPTGQRGRPLHRRTEGEEGKVSAGDVHGPVGSHPPTINEVGSRPPSSAMPRVHSWDGGDAAGLEAAWRNTQRQFEELGLRLSTSSLGDPRHSTSPGTISTH